FDYRKTDFTRLEKRWHLIFDVSATKSLGACRKSLEPGGIYVTTISSGKFSSLRDLTMPLFNPLRSRKGKAILVKPSASDLDYLRGLIEAGRLKTVVERVYPLSEAAAAQQHIETGRLKG